MRTHHHNQRGTEGTFVEVDFNFDSLWAVDASDSVGPLNIPLTFGLCPTSYDIAATQQRLANHPQVLHLEQVRRYTAHETTEVALDVTVSFTGIQWEALTAHAHDYYHEPGAPSDTRPPAPTSWSVTQLGPDMLGLADLALPDL